MNVYKISSKMEKKRVTKVYQISSKNGQKRALKVIATSFSFLFGPSSWQGIPILLVLMKIVEGREGDATVIISAAAHWSLFCTGQLSER